MLHCAGRIGLLTYIYGQRHQIALALGMIDELPMTMCSHEYTPHADRLVIQEHGQSSDTTIPPAAFSAQEINLFLSHPGLAYLDPIRAELATTRISVVTESDYIPPTLSIFHPPC